MPVRADLDKSGNSSRPRDPGLTAALLEEISGWIERPMEPSARFLSFAWAPRKEKDSEIRVQLQFDICKAQSSVMALLSPFLSSPTRTAEGQALEDHQRLIIARPWDPQNIAAAHQMHTRGLGWATLYTFPPCSRPGWSS